MPDADPHSGEPITDKRRLVQYLEAGCKPTEAWRIGTEHEKLAYRLEDCAPLPYDGPRSIRTILEGLTRFGFRPALFRQRKISNNSRPIRQYTFSFRIVLVKKEQLPPGSEIQRSKPGGA